MFRSIYDACLKWAEHKYAKFYLAAVSFSESIFFPIPPDVMLAPMVLAKPKKAWRLAFITTLASVVGGALGYLLGAFLYEPVVAPFIESMAYQDKFSNITHYFNEYGLWIVFLAGFTPIPYKLFTVGAGMLFMPFIPFILASAVGRGGRFFLVAGILYFGGERMKNKIREYVNLLGLLFIGLIMVFAFYKLNS